MLAIFASPKSDLRQALALIAVDQRAKAFKLLTRAAKAGLAEAEYQVARCYLEGAGVPPSPNEALRWLERSATQGFAEAQTLLAAFYVHGVPVAGPDTAPDGAAGTLGSTISPTLFDNLQQNAPPDFEKAMFWAAKAASAGSAEAQALLAFLLASGPPSMRDDAEAERLYQQSAEAGCAQGQLGHAIALARRATSDADFTPVAEWLQKAADAKLGIAQYLLGSLLTDGRGVKADPVRGTELYRLAAEQGVRAGQLRFGLALMNGIGVEKDEVIAESWLRRAAMQGDPDASAIVAQIYARNSGTIPPNMAEAAIWFRRAADAGHVQSTRALGTMHMTGQGVVRNPEEAARLLRKAADSDALAAFQYGICLAEGLGVPRNDAEARVWLSKASEAGVADAKKVLAEMPSNEGGRVRDPA